MISSCEAFENFPPGLPGKAVSLACRMPGGLYAIAQSFRVRALRRSPMALGRMTRRPIPHEVTDRWFDGLIRNPEIRRDLERYVRSVRGTEMLEAAEELRGFDRPTLVVWAGDDRVMPPDHGRRFTDLLPDGRLLEIGDSGTFLPEDQPVAFAEAIRAFTSDPSWVPGPPA